MLMIVNDNCSQIMKIIVNDNLVFKRSTKYIAKDFKTWSELQSRFRGKRAAFELAPVNNSQIMTLNRRYLGSPINLVIASWGNPQTQE